MSRHAIAQLDLPSVASRLTTRDGKRPRIDRVQGRDQLYRCWLQMAIANGAGFDYFRTSWGQTARALGYESVGSTLDDGAHYQGTIRRRADDLAAHRLIEYRPAFRDDGRYAGLDVRILPGELSEDHRQVDITTRRGRRWCGRGTWKRTRSGRNEPPRCVRGVGRQRPPRPLLFTRCEVRSPLRERAPRPRRGLGGARIDVVRVRARGPTANGNDSAHGRFAASPDRETATTAHQERGGAGHDGGDRTLRCALCGAVGVLRSWQAALGSVVPLGWHRRRRTGQLLCRDCWAAVRPR